MGSLLMQTRSLPVAAGTRAIARPTEGLLEAFADETARCSTCKLLDIEPHGYLADVITRIVDGHPQSRLDVLSPGPFPRRPNSAPWPENDAYG
jgi:hypothetical protein